MEELLFQKTNWEEVEGLVYSDLKHPFDVLGPHKTEDGIRICCFFPDAVRVSLKAKRTGKTEPMAQLDDAGVYGILLPGSKLFGYTYLVSYEDGTELEQEDPYAFSPALSEKELGLFEKGIHYEVYQMLGAHKKTVSGVEGVQFAVWAPNAMRVSVVGDFNLWDGRRHMMELQGDSGVFSLFIPGVKEGDLYKYEIRVKGGATMLKADPYASLSQKRPENASVVCDFSDFTWTDKEYLEKRKKTNPLDGPMNIYEVHLGSWKKPTEEDGSFYNYRELAVMLADYVKEMGYTHIELMPVMEHPFDGSWGYQVTGYYAPTSRYGTPQDFMFFMDYMHKQGIGVILDWVPAHFPKDAFGLANFDGTCLYEHKDKRQGEHPHWGTLIYNYARPQVSNFLIANALYWVEQFHADGIRMDAVASMLYLDYGKNDGEWIPNKYGGRENLDAIELLKHLNSIMKKRNKNVLMIAEESTAWPMVSGPVEDGGLGFQLKWNMGWMNDFLQYMRQDPLFRKSVHGCLTFSMVYAYSERFLLVFSHDEVVHGKGSLINKMPGTYEQKFANLRTAYMFMAGHPGKKLLFMGQDFAQFAEWNEAKSLDWNLPEEYDMHREFRLFCKELNEFYKANTALYEQDFVPEGFEWMSCMDADHSIVSFVRRGKKKGDELLFVCNFTPVLYEKFHQAVPQLGKYKEVFNSDEVRFGGTGAVNARQKTAKKVPCDGREQSIEITLPPLGVAVFRFKEEEAKPKKEKTVKAKLVEVKPAETKPVKTKPAKEEKGAAVQKAVAPAKAEKPEKPVKGQKTVKKNTKQSSKKSTK
ncbi:MAG: 1,4-alpha-glucan branching protein GlgB [Lachnospiraceae bacterium]